MASLAPALDHEQREDEELAHLAPTDLTAFAELYRRYQSAMYAFMRSQVSDADAAQDLTAQVFFKALNSASTFRSDGSYAGWLFRIAHNCLATYRRDHSRRPVVLQEVPEQHDPNPTPPVHTIVQETREMLWDRVAELPEDQKQAINLRYIKDLSIEEIGRVMRRSSGAVRVLLHRARLRLRRSIKSEAPR
jgi:RNA polymerase sigma-70 factor, ECF subfamily